MEHTETLIVEQLKIGNEDAYQYIYDRHYALLCHVANGYVKDQFLAETIVGDTIFHLWKKDADFRSAVAGCKGFCTWHYGVLYDAGASKLDKAQYTDFLTCLNQVYFTGMDRVNDDIEWFINKYDYRYANEPWKNSKDAIPRGILKTNHIQVEE